MKFKIKASRCYIFFGCVFIVVIVQKVLSHFSLTVAPTIVLALIQISANDINVLLL